MFSVTVLYPKTADSQFDMEYYLGKHISLVRERLTPLGLTSVDLEAGVAGAAPDSPPAYVAIGRLNFANPADLQNAMTTHGPELVADIANFTDVQPMMQINRSL